MVSRVPNFCCGDCTVRISIPIESSWSTKIKFLIFDLNRGEFDELEQVIDSAAGSVN